MNIRNIAGAVLLASPFVTVAIITTIQHGVWFTALVFGGTALVVGIVLAGVVLLDP